MIDLRLFFRAYEDAAPMSSMMGPDEFVSDTVLACKSGALGSILSTKGQDYETRTADELEVIAKRFATAIRPFDEHWSLYQWFIKRDGAKAIGNSDRARFLERDGLHSIETAMGVLHEPKLKSLFSLGKSKTDTLTHTITEQIAAFTRHADLLGATVLERNDAFAFLRRLLNPSDWYAEAVKYHEPIDRFICTTAIQDGKDAMEWGTYRARVFSLMEEPELEDEDLSANDRIDAPGVTAANMLADLQRISGNFILCTEWRSGRKHQMRRDLRFKRRFRFGQRKSTSLDTKNNERLEDPEAHADIDHLGQSVLAVRRGGFGQFSLVAIAFDKDEAKLERTCTGLVRVFADNDAVLMEERPNRLAAFYSIIPGNSALNFRQRWITLANYADLSFLWKAGSGEPVSKHLKAPCLSIFETPDGTPYYFNRHTPALDATGDDSDVGHMKITGETGSGKTYLANRLIEDEQQYSGYTWIIDKMGRYERITQKMGGQYYRFTLEHQDARFQPFSENTEEAREWQLQFMRLLFIQEGCTPSTEEDREIAQAIKALYVLDSSLRRLGVLASTLPRHLHNKLHRWIGNGAYARFFDHAEPMKDGGQFQCFDFAGISKMPLLMAPVVFCVFRQMDAIVNDPKMRRVAKGAWIDEAWSFLLVPALKERMREAFKVWRNNNAWVTFITQSNNDADPDMMAVIDQTCPTKIYLPNRSVNAKYTEAADLNEREQELLKEMPRGTFLVDRSTGSMVLKYRALETDVLEYETQGAAA